MPALKRLGGLGGTRWDVMDRRSRLQNGNAELSIAVEKIFHPCSPRSLVRCKAKLKSLPTRQLSATSGRFLRLDMYNVLDLCRQATSNTYHIYTTSTDM